MVAFTQKQIAIANSDIATNVIDGRVFEMQWAEIPNAIMVMGPNNPKSAAKRRSTKKTNNKFTPVKAKEKIQKEYTTILRLNNSKTDKTKQTLNIVTVGRFASR